MTNRDLRARFTVTRPTRPARPREYGQERDEPFTVSVDLQVPAGTTAALLGPNGSGKSTVVDALAGLLPISAGRIALGATVLDDAEAGVLVPPEDRRVGVVFQQYLLFDHLDVLDNVAFGPTVTGRTRSEGRTLARGWLELLDLAPLADRRPRELSGGQAQRVALARALATEPDLLLLDEPLAALDVATRSRLRRTLADHLDRYPGPRLLITHDPTDAYLLADQVHILEDGRLTQSGTPDEIRRRPATPYVAALAGRNLLTGRADGGRIALDEHRHELQGADTVISGPVLVTISPSAVALHPHRPEGSPRNTWATTVEAVEPLGDIVRVTLGGPVPLVADVTPAAAVALTLAPGRSVWASLKATEIRLDPA